MRSPSFAFSCRWALLLTLIHSVAGAPLDLYVAPDGDNAHSGTAQQPWATLERARDAIRERLHADPEQSIVVHIQSGVYRLPAPLRFAAEDTPLGNHHLTLRGEGKGPVVLSGGRAIQGWSVTAQGHWRASIPEVREDSWRFRELFLNGRRLTRARHPNEGYLRAERVGPDRRTSFTYHEGDLAPVPDLPRVELVFLHDWSLSRIPLKSLDASTRIVTTAFPVGPAAPHFAMDNFESQPRYFLENSRAYVDAPGEWHLDEETGELLYQPLPGESIETCEFVAPVLTSLLEVAGHPASGRPARHLQLDHLRFEHCAWSPPTGGYAAAQATFYEQRSGAGGTLRNVVPPALSFQRAEGCALRDVTVAHVGGSGIWFGAQCHSNRLERTTVTDVSGNGIMLGEDTGRAVEGQAWWRKAPDQAATGNVITNCLIEACGRQFFGAVGIWVGLTRDTRIVGNEIRQLPYTGVSIGWTWSNTHTPSRNNTVANNHIHHVMQALSDGGGIYTLGWQPGMRLEGNVIHDVPLNLGRAESNGMFLDEGTTGILISGNVISNVVRSPLRFHRATTNVVLNNEFHLKEGVPMIRFNNTRPEDIRAEGNKTVVVP